MADQTIESTNPYVIPVNSALSYLNSFLDADNDMSRNGMRKQIKSVYPIKYTQIQSRYTTDSLDCENLVYVANFEGNQGYAILAGDIRISDKIIAVTDNGSLDYSTISSIQYNDAEEIRPFFNEYPADGPGFFTVPEYSDELFINPNTVSWYVEAEQDTLVGNFCLNEENDNLVQDNTPGNITSPELLMCSMCLNYATSEIENNKHLYREYDTEPAGSCMPTYDIQHTTTESWSIIKNVDPILDMFCYWHQHRPFKNKCPKRRKYILFGRQDNAPAGCFPLAIAKIMTHFEYPQDFSHNGVKIDWKGLKYKNISNIDEQSAAYLLRAIVDGCDCWCFYEGTFTFPSKAERYLRLCGYQNARSYDYKFDRVTKMLDSGKPVIIYGLPGINIFKAHCWNIDGYKIKEKTTSYNTYREGELIDVKEVKDTVNMVHCDFGWKNAHCKGYYVSGLFKLNSNEAEYDNPRDSKEKRNYNNHVKIVTYDK